jgi:hypothetical protein
MKRFLSTFLVILAILASPQVFASTLTTGDIISRGPLVDVRAFTNLSTAKAYAETNNLPLEITTPVSCNALTIKAEVYVLKSGTINQSGPLAVYNMHAGLNQVFVGTGAVSLPAGAKINAAWWGYSPSTSNNAVPIQAAINSLSTGLSTDHVRGGDIDIGGGGTYYFTSGINLPTDVSFSGKNVTWDFSALTSGVAIAVNEYDGNVYNATTNSISGLTIRGNGSTYSPSLTLVGLGNTGGNRTVFYNFNNVNLQYAGTMASVTSNSWCINFNQCDIGNYAGGATTGIGFAILAGGSQYGERYSFNQCTFYGLAKVFYSQITSNTGDIYVANSSFDYNSQLAVIAGTTDVNITNCHIESSFDAVWFSSTSSNVYTNFNIANSYILWTNTSGNTNYFYSAADIGSSVNLVNVTYGAPWRYLPRYLGTGGRVNVQNISSENQNYIFDSTLLLDPNFNSASVVDWDTTGYYSAGNVVASTISTSTFHLAANSLKLSSGTGVWCCASHTFTVPPGHTGVAIRFWYLTSGTVNSNNVLDISVLGLSQNNTLINGNVSQITTSASTWTSYTKYAYVQPGTYRLALELYNYGGAPIFYIDEADVEVF